MNGPKFLKHLVLSKNILLYRILFIKRYPLGANVYIIIHVHTTRNFKNTVIKRIMSDHLHLSVHRHLFHSKNICPPPLPYFKVNIYPLRLNIFRLFVILSLTQLYRYTPEIFLFFDCHIYIYLPGPPQTNWTRIFSECGLLKISVHETDTATSGLRWIFHMHSEFSRPAMCNNAT